MKWSSIKKSYKPRKDYEVPSPDFVQKNLASFVKNKSSKSWFLLCPFHPDRSSPSLSVIVENGHKQPVGFFKCFGCGKKGYWNELALALNMETVDGYKLDLTEADSISFDSDPEPDEIEEPSSEKVNIKTLVPWPKNKSWRGFAGKIVQKYDGWYNKFDPDYPLVFLCRRRNSKKVIGFIRCRTKKKKGYKSYLFSKGEWTSNYIWPEHKLSKTDRLVLVEGARDALAWICRGVLTGAILGTSSGLGSRRKATLMGMGVDELVLFMDGDHAGENAVFGKWEDGDLVVEGLQSLAETDFIVRVFKTWFHFPEKDPFKLAKDANFVRKFKKWLEMK